MLVKDLTLPLSRFQRVNGDDVVMLVIHVQTNWLWLLMLTEILFLYS